VEREASAAAAEDVGASVTLSLRGGTLGHGIVCFLKGKLVKKHFSVYFVSFQKKKKCFLKMGNSSHFAF
jgi:hypothetical protein